VLHVVPLRYIPIHDRYCPIRKNNNMIWLAALSTFVLNRVCELVMKEKAGVQFFKNLDLMEIVQAILKFTGREVGVAQVYNYLRHWRARWVHVCRFKKMDGVHWVEKTSSIMMDHDAYYTYTKVSALHLILQFIH
jgi:hypothetical protein